MRVRRLMMPNSITQQLKGIFGSCVCVGEILAIPTRHQNNSVHQSFRPMIFDAKEGR